MATKKRVLVSILTFMFVFSLVSVPSSVNASDCNGHNVTDPSLPPCPSGSITGTEGEASVTGRGVILSNPLGNAANWQAIVANVIKGILGIVGIVALIMFIYGGITWMTSLGNAERVKTGRDTLVWASLGLVVVFASFAIVNLILSALNTAAS